VFIPLHWREALAFIQTSIDPFAVMAGGALRDQDHGVAAKDVDIFVGDSIAMNEVVARITREFDNCTIVMGPAAASYVSSNDEVDYVLEFTWLDTPFQVIGLTGEVSAERVLSRIDFGFCRIAFNGRELLKPAEYLKDKKDRTFTVYRADNGAQLDRTVERHQRLQARYPGYPLIISPEIEKRLGLTYVAGKALAFARYAFDVVA
jgi:hypothetical protein